METLEGLYGKVRNINSPTLMYNSLDMLKGVTDRKQDSGYSSLESKIEQEKFYAPSTRVDEVYLKATDYVWWA